MISFWLCSMKIWLEISTHLRLIKKLSQCSKEPKIRFQGDGSLLIEVSSPEESERLMKMSKLVGLNVKCIPHPTFNQCRGVIYAPELLSIDADEIQTIGRAECG